MRAPAWAKPQCTASVALFVLCVLVLQFTHAERPPVLDSLAKLRTKIEMMEQLLEVLLEHVLPQTFT